MNLNENPLFQVSARGGFIPRAALIVAAVALCLTAGAAQAFENRIRVDNTYYYVNYQATDYNASSGGLTSTAWFENKTLAEDLARASSESATPATTNNYKGAVFLYDTANMSGSIIAVGSEEEAGKLTGVGGSFSTDYTYATQAQAPTAVPEIDGVALSQGAFVTGALALWLFGWRRAGAMP
ncbi:hypothetical protein V6X63_10140 [Spiribacter sp. 221]|uniref:hypothetical protein n=1 Tax=Spiribacter onubensis TaxID=3122420 RepID=UPI00349F5F54